MPRTFTISIARLIQGTLLACAVLSVGCGFAVPVMGILAGGGGGGGGPEPKKSVVLTVETTVDLLNSPIIDAAGNTIGTPQVTLVGPNTYRVVVELDDVAPDENVILVCSANTYLSLDPGGSIVVYDVCFYPYPPSQIPPGPSPCPPARGPLVHWRSDTALGAVLELTNGNTTPMNVLLEGAASPAPLDAADVYPGSAASDALAWSPLFAGGLGPQQTVLVDLADAAPPGAAAVLLRASSSVGGIEQRALYHLEVISSPVPASRTTWGGIKALYR